MINENRIGLQSNVWAVAVPVLLISVLTIGASTFTDAIARVAIGLERRPSGKGQRTVERWRGETLRMGLLYEAAAVEFWAGVVADAQASAQPCDGSDVS